MNFWSVPACLVCVCLWLHGPPPAAGAAEGPAARDVMKRVEEGQRISSEAVAFEMVLTDKTGFERRRSVREFRRRFPDNREASLVFFDYPPDIRGSALLSKERPDGFDDQWLYLPAVGKNKRIADSGRTDYFLGTDLTFEDFSVEDIDRFTYVFAGPDTVVAGRPLHMIDAVASDSVSQKRSGYGLRRLYVDVERNLILRTDYFDREGKLLKILQTLQVVLYDLQIQSPQSAVRNPNAVWRANQVFVENFQRRHKTRIRITGRNFLNEYPPDFFSPRTLPRGVSSDILSHLPRTIPDMR